MKKLLITTFISTLVFISYAQTTPNWQWAKIGGGVGKDSGNFMTIDSQGNVYVYGVFRDNNIVIESVTLTNAGDDDVFLAKYNPNGNLIWAKSIGNTGLEFPNAIFIDKNDDIYISGFFQSSTLTFGSITLINPTPSNSDLFTAKYNTSGQVVWAKNSSNSNLNFGFMLGVDNSLNIYFLTGTSGLTTIEKYNSSDNLIWSKTIVASGGIATAQLRGFYVDTSGIYLTGGFFGISLTIGGVTLINNTPVNSDDMFVARLDTAGNLLWAKNAIGNSADNGQSIIVDNFGNSYVLGKFSTGVIFDSFSLISNGNNDLFLVKYNSSGQALWAKSTGGSANDWVGDLALDANGNAYIIGETFSPFMTFASTTLTNSGSTASSADIYILKYDSSGNEIWMETIQALGSDNGNGIVVNNNTGEVYVTGAIEDISNSTTNIGSTPLTHFGLDDVFLAKLSSTVSIDEKTSVNPLFIYPNPNNGKFIIDINNTKSANIEVYNISGQLILQKTLAQITSKINLTNHPKGMYFVRVKMDNKSMVRKIVYQ